MAVGSPARGVRIGTAEILNDNASNESSVEIGGGIDGYVAYRLTSRRSARTFAVQ